ncbi:hypothetical protein Micbo1qcDRAFT_164348, partial [Microdochium bolleyi]
MLCVSLLALSVSRPSYCAHAPWAPVRRGASRTMWEPRMTLDQHISGTVRVQTGQKGVSHGLRNYLARPVVLCAIAVPPKARRPAN